MRKLYFKIMAVLFAGTIAVVLTGCSKLYGPPPSGYIQNSTITKTIDVTPSAAPTTIPTTTPVSSPTNIH